MKPQNETAGSLSHWDMESEFTGDEVAALVFGEDPSQVGYVNSLNRPIYRRLEKSYNACRRWHLLADDAPLNWDEIGVASEVELLRSVGVVQALKYFDLDDAVNLSNWLTSDGQSGFGKQRFARAELTQWLAANGIKSVYKFGGNSSNIGSLEGTLSTKERYMVLKIIIGMAIKGYNYDPAAAHSVVTKEITDDIRSLGMPIDGDTVRKYLTAAKETVLPQKTTPQP